MSEPCSALLLWRLGVPGPRGIRRGGKGVSRLAEAHLEVATAAATAEVPVLKEVQHGLAARGKGPEVSLSLFVAFCAGYLCSNKAQNYN